jgi:DNA-binding beta-propeller fold protein YncE
MLKEKLARIAAVLGALAVLAALVVAFGLAMVPRAQEKPGNYIAYSLEGLDKVSEDEILYREAAPVKVPAAPDAALTGVCLLPGGGFAVSGGAAVFVYDAGRALARTIAASGPVLALAAGAGRIYLGMSDHVEVWSADGRPLDEWASLGEKALVASLAAAKDAVYVADAGDKNVAQYDPGGRLVRFISLKNSDGSGFLVPGVCFDVAVDASGSLWAVDPGRRRVLKISPAGEILAAWGKTSTALDGFSGCCNPVNIALFPDGSFVAQEKGLLRIKLYDRNGAFLGVVAGPTSFDASLSSLDLAAGADGTVYAVDDHLKSVRIFVKKGEGDREPR